MKEKIELELEFDERRVEISSNRPWELREYSKQKREAEKKIEERENKIWREKMMKKAEKKQDRIA